MKLVKIVISLALVAMTVYGWLTVGRTTLGAPSVYSSYVSDGDKSFEAGLYEDAYEKYTAALSIKSSTELTDKQVEAYTLFYTQEEYGVYSTRQNLLSVLDRARRTFPTRAEYALQEIDLYLEGADYTSARKVCQQSMEENKDNEDLLLRWKDIVSTFTLDYNYYSEYREQPSETFATSSGLSWQWIPADNSRKKADEYAMIGQIGTEGIFLAREEDKGFRFYDMDGVARGSAEGEYLRAGVYREGLCPAERVENEWYYLNLDGEAVLGPYRQAGCFTGGIAAVQGQDGMWRLINQEGQKIEGSDFVDIRLDLSGSWLCGETVLAAREAGKYLILDGGLNPVCERSFAKLDIPTEYGLFAFEEGGKWGFVNSKGEVVIEPRYKQAKSFRNGLAAVCDETGLWGFVKADGEMATRCQFLDAGYVSGCGSVMVSDIEDMYRLLQYMFLPDLVG